ncbi:M56 family metallopeptidase [Lacrimispora sp. JR3]|uniref:M56 family metallopeptidase n=1 Tax=Lacrimispora sinapis TaxID=3111456 RepID=UPI0037480C8B
MVISPASFITILMIFNIAILFLWLFLKSHKMIVQIRISILLTGIILVLVRLVIPFEFQFQRTIGDKYFLPTLFSFLYTPIANVFSFRLCIYHVCLFIWLLGIIFLSGRIMYCYTRFKNRIEQESFVPDDFEKKILEKINCTHKKPKQITIIKTNLVPVPLLFGLFKPTILLPDLDLSDRELYYILLHETTHYYHYDLWIKLLIEFVSILYWWNPLIYILRPEIDKIMELRADEVVTKSFHEAQKLEYLECLLKIAKGMTPANINNFSLSFDSRAASVLFQRFHVVLNNSTRKSNITCSILLTIISLFLISASFIVIEPYSVKTDVQQQTVQITPENSYLIRNPKKGYDLYVNNQYFGSVTEISDLFSKLPIYNNSKEVPIHET